MRIPSMADLQWCAPPPAPEPHRPRSAIPLDVQKEIHRLRKTGLTWKAIGEKVGRTDDACRRVVKGRRG